MVTNLPYIIGVTFVNDIKKYFWLRLDRNFFKRHDIRIIENMENGKEYVLFYMKLLLESIDHEGSLRFNDLIPYNDSMLATITNTNIDIVRSAVKIFRQLEIMEILDDQTIYITETRKMLGEAKSTQRVQRFREKQKTLALETPRNVTETENETKIELEKEIELELDTEKEIDKNLNNNTKAKRKPKTKIDIDNLLAESGHEQDVLDVIADFMDMRVSIKKPMSYGAVKLLLSDIKALPDQRPAYIKKALELSIIKNYMSVYPIRNERDLPPEEKIEYVEERDPNENISWFDPRFDPNACCRKTSVGTGT